MKKTLKNAIVKTGKALGAGKIRESVAHEAQEGAEKEPTPWWVIALKTLVYLIGLLLAGYGTSAAAQTLLAI